MVNRFIDYHLVCRIIVILNLNNLFCTDLQVQDHADFGCMELESAMNEVMKEKPSEIYPNDPVRPGTTVCCMSLFIA